MTTSTPEPTSVAEIADLATRATKPHILEPGKVHGLVDSKGVVHLVDLDKDQYRNAPRRTTGAVYVHDVESFVEYLAKHGRPETEIWADTTHQRLIAIIDAHAGTNQPAGWRQHRLIFEVLTTPAWQAWVKNNRDWLGQVDFAEHIEDRAIDIVTPSGAEMLEIAQSISATSGVEFESSQLLSSGERQLVFKETVSAKAGQRGQLDIPTLIELALTPFAGATAYKVKARFRYRITGGALKLAYALERPEDVIRDAFTDLLERVNLAVEQPVYAGRPE